MADAEQIVRDVADRVRELISQAEEQASQIVRDAEVEAKRIRERAESEGKERLDELRKALDDLQGRLGTSGAPAASVQPQPAPTVEPKPAAEPTPAAANGGAKPDDTAGARLVAMNMALDGSARDRILAKLSEDFELDDAGALVDEVLALAAK
jgi:ElaB/YqjD/DUF883 family membrane-anchored ribosome-binding protein